MQSGRRLVEDVEGIAALDPLKFSRELDPLRLTSGQLGRGLAQPQVTQTHLAHDRERTMQRWLVSEKLPGRINCHSEHVGDGFIAVLDLKRVGIVPSAVAGRTWILAMTLEHMEKVDTLVVDKTGTLTEGRPAVTAIVPALDFTETEVLRLSASAERPSEHPLAIAIVEAAEKQGITTAPVTDFDSPTGKGAFSTVEGRRVVLGSAKFLAEHGIDVAPLAEQADKLREDGATAIFAGIDGKVAGTIAIADPVKATTPEALAGLKEEGIRVVMLTGDNWTTAKAVARQLGIDEVEAEVLPEQKSAVVEKFKREGRVVAMAGDGVNDAPALAAADVGIAMGTGTDVAMESAGVTLLKGDLTGIVRAHRLSRATMRNIRQNLFFAFIYNALGVPVAAGVLYPFFGILLSPIIAAAAMALSSVSVIGNAVRLRTVKL
ncbi:ATPase, P-type (transporting), HAD superfamily, subfamily IC/heavy metal translocating P-type ATPase [Microvirga guangxiensis]|uniref:P-type Cu(+) transporter n=1 Tax=Microvirga guangxiensis TaxID=549386 RepID=A0A1G5JZ99_9HYPH|nr:ATPase, P-type (transporting), HAD superfamily, subfamily IC/heavy metal translocating P-type ATPase [Microvirga guangxiensis]